MLTPPKKHRNEYEVSADERSRTNDNVPTEVKESITSFIKQVFVDTNIIVSIYNAQVLESENCTTD